MKSALERFRDTIAECTQRPKAKVYWVMKYKGEQIITLRGKGTWAKEGFARASLRNMLSFDMYRASSDIYHEYGYTSRKRKAIVEADFKEFLKEVEFIQIKEVEDVVS